ncbi:hypothetical protein VPH35_105957 [Triticum aestivum]|uniref:Uncharacterized protein n=1 Tax=Triticum aestivum TaxID=4565 RepID=A0A3B6NS71_WHEAT
MKKEEPASPPRSSRRAPVLAPFTINPRPAGERDRQYLAVDVCRRYWETRTPVPWSDIHLPNGWHLADRVPIPPVLASGRARRPSAAAASSRTTCSTTTAEEEARLLKRVMDDSMYTHDERQWDGLEEAMALSAARDIAFPELQMVAVEERRKAPAAFQQLLGKGWGWSCTAPEMAAGMGVNWCPTPPRSPEREASPREEVVQAPPAVQPDPVHHAPPAHLWTPPAYVDLVSDDDDTDGQ